MFENYVQKGNEFINQVADELKTTDKARASRITRCVLRALRNRLTTEESFQLIAQLPMALKAVYVDGWKLNAKQVRIKHVNDFLEEVMHHDGFASWHDFASMEEAREGVDAVFKTLASHVSPGEIDGVIAVLPFELKSLLTEAISY